MHIASAREGLVHIIHHPLQPKPKWQSLEQSRTSTPEVPRNFTLPGCW